MKNGQIDFIRLFKIALRKWYLFAASLALFLGLAWYYLQTKAQKYEASAVLMIKEEKKSGIMSKEALLKDLGVAVPNKNLENEVQIIRSSPLIEKVVRKLNLQYNYIGKRGRRKYYYYLNSPVTISAWIPKFEGLYLEAELHHINDHSYHLFFEDEEFAPERVKYVGRYDQELSLPVGIIKITKDSTQTPNGPITLEVSPVSAAVAYIKDESNIQMAGLEQASTLSMTMKDYHPHRAKDILNELAYTYNESSMASKTEVYKNTIEMLDDRIRTIAQELAIAEQSMQNYKSQNSMMELSAEGNILIKELTDHNKKITDTDIQLEVLNNIEQFINNNVDSFEFVPTNSQLTNLTLTQQIADLNELISNFQTIKKEKGPAHPDWILAEKQVHNKRMIIAENIGSIKSDLMITRDAHDKLKGNLQGRLQSLPARERGLAGIERQKNIKEDLYVYLLEKREETAISLAAVTPTGSLLEPAEAPNKPVSPIPAQIWLIAGFLGMALPSGVIFLLDQFSDRIETEDELKSATSVPVAGIVGHSGKNEPLIIKERSYTIAAELFRLLRINLDYVIPEKGIQTVLVTSSTEGEGKSYISLNLAMTQAIAGKKVLILELDLRRPKQTQNIKLNKLNKGVVNFLSDKNLKASKIIQKSGLHRNLDVIVSGPRPSNPNELLLSGRLRELMEELKGKYDFIILDAPPVGIVSDALQMKDLTDATMYVVRSEYTTHRQLRIIEDIAKNCKLPNPFIVLNDVHLKRQGYYQNGYSYFGETGYFQKLNESN